MKVSDYIASFLVEKGITDIFGYPGGTVSHFMDSLGKYQNQIATHITLHEQSASFAACGYAQATGKVGVAFATSGPGATNLITGISNAYFDSIPTVFITGQVNTFESRGNTDIRQKGFQEMNVIDLVSNITKAAIYVDDANKIKYILEKAFYIALSNRKGPVVLDIPMNIFRAEIEENHLEGYTASNKVNSDKELVEFKESIHTLLRNSQRPCVLVGNGVRQSDQVEKIREFADKSSIPIVSSMLGIDILTKDKKYQDKYFGFLGAYGDRTANFIVAKSDLLITLGSRLDGRQTGGKRELFAPNAQIVRIDIDSNELQNKVREGDQQFNLDLKEVVPILQNEIEKCKSDTRWLEVCKEIKEKLQKIDDKKPNELINKLSKSVPDNYSIVTDVGQNMVWVAQSFGVKQNQRLYFSGGHGAMGYALPASIGIYYATQKPVLCISGDGGFQMNIQELQFIKENHLPIKMVVINNKSLGMIRHFQEMYFNSQYYFTVDRQGYSVPDFNKIVEAYGIKAISMDEIDEDEWNSSRPVFIEVTLPSNTIVAPKLEYGKPNQDQEPLIDRELYHYLNQL